MSITCENVYEMPQRNQVSSQEEPAKETMLDNGLSVKVLGVSGFIILALLVIPIALHFHQQAEWRAEMREIEKNMKEDAEKNFQLTLKEIRQLQKNTTDDLNHQSLKRSELFEELEVAKEKITHLEIGTDYQSLGSKTSPARSCDAIKKQNATAPDGLYYLMNIEGEVFQTFCSMTIAEGGWTLVASVHENNMKGRCTAGDRWSSEQRNSAAHPHGDGFWENRATHGEATSATSDDYKNSGYFAMNASDIMIWQVPNDTPLRSFATRAFLKYHTTSGFLRSHGGNLAHLFSVDYNMRKGQYKTSVDNGPAIPITWDTGSNEELLGMLGINVRSEVEVGYVQFRTINNERDAFALCPGMKIKPGKGNVEHMCLGSTSTTAAFYCGDFASADYPDAAWQLDQRLIDSVLMIFYK